MGCLVFLVLLVSVHSVVPSTNISLTLLKGNYSLNKTGSPYFIKDEHQNEFTTHILSTELLMIDPGVQLMFPANYRLKVTGKIVAQGSPTEKIDFVFKTASKSLSIEGSGSVFSYTQFLNVGILSIREAFKLNHITVVNGSVNLLDPASRDIDGFTIRNSPADGLSIFSPVTDLKLQNVIITNSSLSGLVITHMHPTAAKPVRFCSLQNTTLDGATRLAWFQWQRNCTQVFKAKNAGDEVFLEISDRVAAMHMEVRDGNSSKSELLSSKFSNNGIKRIYQSTGGALWINMYNRNYWGSLQSEFLVYSSSSYGSIQMSNSQIENFTNVAIDVDLFTHLHLSSTVVSGASDMSATALKVKTMSRNKNVVIINSNFHASQGVSITNGVSGNVTLSNFTFSGHAEDIGHGLHLNNSVLNAGFNVTGSKSLTISDSHFTSAMYVVLVDYVNDLSVYIDSVVVTTTPVSVLHVSHSSRGSLIDCRIRNSTFSSEQCSIDIKTRSLTSFIAHGNVFLSKQNCGIRIRNNNLYEKKQLRKLMIEDNVFQGEPDLLSNNSVIHLYGGRQLSSANAEVNIAYNRFENMHTPSSSCVELDFPCDLSVRFTENSFQNVSSKYILRDVSLCWRDGWTDPQKTVASRNWWGSSERLDIIRKVTGYHMNVSLREIEVFPFYTSADKSSLYVGAVDYTMNSGGLFSGGHVNSTLVLTSSDSPYRIEHDINVLKHGKLVLEPGAHLQFVPHTRLLVQGELQAQGTPMKRIVLDSAIQPFTHAVRLGPKGSILKTVLEVQVDNRWGPVCITPKLRLESLNFLCSLMGYDGQTFLTPEKATVNYAAVAVGINCNSNVDNFTEDCTVAPCTEPALCTACQIITLRCEGKSWAGVHLADGSKSSILQHLLIEHVDGRSTAITVDRHHHVLSDLEIVSQGVGLAIQRAHFRKRSSLSNLTVAVWGRICVTAMDTSLSVENFRCHSHLTQYTQQLAVTPSFPRLWLDSSDVIHVTCGDEVNVLRDITVAFDGRSGIDMNENVQTACTLFLKPSSNQQLYVEALSVRGGNLQGSCLMRVNETMAGGKVVTSCPVMGTIRLISEAISMSLTLQMTVYSGFVLRFAPISRSFDASHLDKILLSNVLTQSMTINSPRSSVELRDCKSTSLLTRLFGINIIAKKFHLSHSTVRNNALIVYSREATVESVHFSGSSSGFHFAVIGVVVIQNSSFVNVSIAVRSLIGSESLTIDQCLFENCLGCIQVHPMPITGQVLKRFFNLYDIPDITSNASVVRNIFTNTETVGQYVTSAPVSLAAKHMNVKGNTFHGFNMSANQYVNAPLALLLLNAADSLTFEANNFEYNSLTPTFEALVLTRTLHSHTETSVTDNVFIHNSLEGQGTSSSCMGSVALSWNGTLAPKIHENIFNNPSFFGEISIRKAIDEHEQSVDISRNYWGTSNSEEISAKIKDGRQFTFLELASFSPYYNSSSKQHLVDTVDTVSTFHGGTVTGNLTLTAELSPYEIHYHVVVEVGSRLVIKPGVELRFSGGVGIMVFGELYAVGTSDQRIKLVLLNSPPYVCMEQSEGWAGVQFLGQPGQASTMQYVDLSQVSLHVFHYEKRQSIAVQVYEATPVLRHLNIKDSYGGIYLYKTTRNISVSHINVDCGDDGKKQGAAVLVTEQNFDVSIMNSNFRSSYGVQTDILANILQKNMQVSVGTFTFCRNRSPMYVPPGGSIQMNAFIGQSRSCGRKFYTDNNYIVGFTSASPACFNTSSVPLANSQRYYEQQSLSNLRVSNSSSVTIWPDCHEDQLRDMQVFSIPKMYAPCTFTGGFCDWTLKQDLSDLVNGSYNVTQWHIVADSFACAGTCLTTANSTKQAPRRKRQAAVQPSTSTLSSILGNGDDGQQVAVMEKEVKPDDNVCKIHLQYFSTFSYYGRYDVNLTLAVRHSRYFKIVWSSWFSNSDPGYYISVYEDIPPEYRNSTFIVMVIAAVKAGKGLRLDNLRLDPCSDVSAGQRLQTVTLSGNYFDSWTMAVKMKSQSSSYIPSSTPPFLVKQPPSKIVNIVNNKLDLNCTACSAVELNVKAVKVSIVNNHISGFAKRGLWVNLIGLSNCRVNIIHNYIGDAVTSDVAIRISGAYNSDNQANFFKNTIQNIQVSSTPHYLVYLTHISSSFFRSIIASNSLSSRGNSFHFVLSNGQHDISENVFLFNKASNKYSSRLFYLQYAAFKIHNNIIVNPDVRSDIYINRLGESGLLVNATYNWWGSNIAQAIWGRMQQSRRYIYSNQAMFIVEPYREKPFNLLSFISTKCNVGWEETPTSCITVLTGGHSYSEAVYMCQKQGGNLLSVARLTELASLVRSMAAYNNSEGNNVYPQLWTKKERSDGDCTILQMTGNGIYQHQVPCTLRYAAPCESVQTSRCPNSCYGQRGSCEGTTCVCKPGWTGEDCSVYECSAIANCSGNGRCVGPNRCECIPGWQGSSCSFSACRRHYDCSRCTARVGCGWCDDEQSSRQCYPGTPSGITGRRQSCRAWFYHRCSTTENSDCSRFIKSWQCKSQYCNTGKFKDSEKCQACNDYENCFSLMNNNTCHTWNETRCPGGVVAVNYANPERILQSKVRSNVKIFSPNETTFYSCPVLFGASVLDDSSLIVASSDLDLNVGDIVSSAQSGGISHTIHAKKTFAPYVFIRASPAKLEDVISYADFRNDVDLIPLDDEQIAEDVPDDQFLEDVLTQNISLPNLQIVKSDVPVYKCVGHGYEQDTQGNIDYSFYIVMAANSETRKITNGTILAGNGSRGFLETVTRVQALDIGVVVETEMTECTDDSSWTPQLRMSQTQDFTCTGGTGRKGLNFYNANDNGITTGSIVPGRKSRGFVAQVAKVTEKTGYLFIEAISVNDVDEDGNVTTSLDLTSISKERRVRRKAGIVERIRNFFRKNFKPKLSGKVTATTTVRVTFEPKVKLKLRISASKPYVHEVGVGFSGKLEGFVEQRIDFQGSFSASGPKESRYSHPINNKQIGTFALPIWPYPLLTLPGRFLFDVTFKVTAKADIKGFLSGSITATGTMDVGVTWRPNSNLDVEGPTFGFGLTKKFDGELDKEKTKASLTAVLTPALKAQWPSVPTLPSYVKWILPNSIEKFLGIGKARQSVSILQAKVSAPFFVTLWAEACSTRCKDPKKPLSIGVRGGLKSVNGNLNVKAFGYQKNFNFLRYSNAKLIASGSKCIGQPVPCCICDDGKPGYIDPKTKECMCECFCDPPANTVKSVKTKTGECECDKCPDGSPKVKKRTGELWCPCDCVDGSVGEQNQDGTCNCECTCLDGSKDVLDTNGDCPCRCKCKNCEDSTKGPDGCICPNDICPKCRKGVPTWSNCECKCIEEYECGVPPACSPGMKGPTCSQPDCSACNNCNGHGYCRRSGRCSSYCSCRYGWLGKCCSRKDPHSGSGDPHFVTLDGCRHDFMGIGEYWDCASEKLDLGVQVRFWGQRYGVSLTGGIAVKIGADKFTVMSYKGGARVRLNDELLTKRRGEIRLADDTAVLSVSRNIYTIDFDNDVSLTVRVHSWGRAFLSYSLGLPERYRKQVYGLCGNFDGDCTNDMVGPDGQKYTHPYDFGASWKINSSANSSSLWSWTSSNFSPNDSMDFDYINPNYVPRKPKWFRGRRAVTEIEMKARKICADKQITGVLFDNCVDDIVLMNDTSFGDQEVFKIVECPSACNDHGSCVNGSCVCIDGWSGDECDIGACGTLQCSIHGECIKGFCKCGVGWEGPTCQKKATCYNVDNCTDVDHGVCQTTDKCLCNVGYTGDNCSIIATCYNRANCSGNGVCVDIDVCRCHTGWTGENCAVYSCESVGFCSGQGQCTGFDICSCSVGWTGSSCTTADCPDVKQCSQQGTCSAPNTCECNQGYTGQACDQLISCPEFNDCSGHGVCFNVTGVLSCTCDLGYSGANCSVTDCSSVNNCSGNGQCDQPDVCTCHPGYKGTTCSEFSCEALNYCSGHGFCQSMNLCNCSQGWSGSTCNQASCSQVNDCSGRGQCIAPDVCDCFGTYDGPACNEDIGPNKYTPAIQAVPVVTLPDNVKTGSFVVNISATDNDSSGKNTLLGFSLMSHTDKFSITNQGQISTSSAIDFDYIEERRLSLLVKVYDHGFPRLSASTTVTIMGLDDNDNCPKFTHVPTDPLELPDDTPVDTKIYSFHAVDKDSGNNSLVVYDLLSDTGSPSPYFSINGSGDVMTVVEPLVSGRYLLMVVAKDSAVYPCQTKAGLIVLVSKSYGTTTQLPTTPGTSVPPTEVPSRPTVSEEVSPSIVVTTADVTVPTTPSAPTTTVPEMTTTTSGGLSDTVKLVIGITIPVVVLLIVVIVVIICCMRKQATRKHRANITYAAHTNPTYAGGE